jgi:hypothetical protein
MIYELIYKIGIWTNYIFNNIFVTLIWTDKPTKNYWVGYMSQVIMSMRSR